ncbi:MAG: ISL3 family transposase [Rhodocyclaceae bacterium]|nr:ISL3 family transposase [Rhodocyclaceae bacterium]
MGAVIPVGILGYEGQVIKEVREDEATGCVTLVCRRDRRHRPVDPKSGRTGPVNRWLRRTVRDIPLGGRPCEVEIEYAQIYLSPSCVRVEALPFVAPGTRATRRLARLVSGLCRHMPIDAVARHTGLSWHSVKALDAAFLAETVVPPRPELLADIRYLGVDEVARAKGHDYLTLVYDLTPGGALRPHPVGEGGARCGNSAGVSGGALAGMRRRDQGRRHRHGAGLHRRGAQGVGSNEVTHRAASEAASPSSRRFGATRGFATSTDFGKVC